MPDWIVRTSNFKLATITKIKSQNLGLWQIFLFWREGGESSVWWCLLWEDQYFVNYNHLDHLTDIRALTSQTSSLVDGSCPKPVELTGNLEIFGRKYLLASYCLQWSQVVISLISLTQVSVPHQLQLTLTIGLLTKIITKRSIGIQRWVSSDQVTPARAKNVPILCV